MTDINSTDHHAEERLDRALDLLRSLEPEPGVAEAAADRVWTRLQAAARSGDEPVAVTLEAVEGCDDVQALLPDFLAGRLSETRAMLVDDHTRECIPCRRALKLAREGKSTEDVAENTLGEKAPVVSIHARRWALAAALVTALGAGWMAVQSLLPAGPVGTIHTVDGNLFRVADDLQVPIRTGDELLEGETVRTGRGSGAVLQLADGSLVEMRERSELDIREGRRGTTIDLERGAVIVQAAPQGAGHLFVATDDCQVAVTGTIFSVDHGTRGSRVAVIEGEVKVRHAGQEDTLNPGDLVATQEAQLGSPAIAREISWSRNVDEYLELLQAYDGLEEDLREQVVQGQRYSSRLLDLVPADTVIYAALPNLGETVAETNRIVREQMEQNPILAEWWAESRVGEIEDATEQIVDRLEELGDVLGEEIVVTGHRVPDGDLDGPLVLAETVNGPGLRDLIAQTWAELAPEAGDAEIVLVEDPNLLPTSASDDTLWVWMPDSMDVLVATPRAERLREVAAHIDGMNNPFVGSPFHDRLSELYREGAEILIGVDLEHAIVADESPDTQATMDRLGFADARHLILEQKTASTKVHHRAVATFSGERRGIASWLAEPAPMGSLDFVSPEAALAGAVVFKDPVALFDDIHEISGSETSAGGIFAHFEEEYGLSLRDDVAGALGGELAFAIDGPILPTPAWKLVLEVYDPARIQWALEQAVAEANVQLAQNGEQLIVMTEDQAAGRSWYSLESQHLTVHYTFDSGYWIMAPSRALVDRALQYREAGLNITGSSRFQELLPVDGRNNFSLIAYQDLGPLVESIADRIAEGNLSEDQAQTLEAIKKNSAAGLGYAYGESDRIIVAAASETDVLRSAVLTMLGLRNPAGMAEVLPELFAGI